MRKTTYTQSAHTADSTPLPANAASANNGLPTRLMAAFQEATCIACQEETVRRAYLRGLLVSQRFGVRGRRFRPEGALERPDAIEEFTARYANRAVATRNRYLARLRHICNWAIGRDLLTATPFHPRGLRIVTKNERRRDRRISEQDEQQLFDVETVERSSARQCEADVGRRSEGQGSCAGRRPPGEP